MIRLFGEAAILVELDSADQAQALAASLRTDPTPGVIEAVPGLASLLVELDPLLADADPVAAAIERRLVLVPNQVVDGLRARILRLLASKPQSKGSSR